MVLFKQLLGDDHTVIFGHGINVGISSTTNGWSRRSRRRRLTAGRLIAVSSVALLDSVGAGHCGE